MSSVTIVGTQWGDEGKGKIVDWLANQADIVVRFQGGHNAGHTIQLEKNKYKLSLLPSGILRGKLSLIGNGTVLDPWALKEEIKILNSQGIKVDNTNLKIAENVPIILPFYKKIDEANEIQRKSNSIGTTKRGIGPAYEDKVGRRVIKLCDLEDKKELFEKINKLTDYHNVRLREYKFKEFDHNQIYDELIEISSFLLPYSFPVWKIINSKIKEGRKILFEGAQGSLLDIDFGTYPYVTSSNTLSGQIYSGSGVGNLKNNYILGITKAYTTRVGSGPFPTELKDKIGDHLIEVGKEFGTVTNRKRRCGWFDSVLVNQTAILNGLNSIAITKLDVLDKLEEIKICIGYNIENKKIDYFPPNQKKQNLIQPEYLSMEGWQNNTFGINKWDDLPLNAKKYLKKIEELVDCKISIVSTSPERNDTIMIESPF